MILDLEDFIVEQVSLEEIKGLDVIHMPSPTVLNDW